MYNQEGGIGTKKEIKNRIKKYIMEDINKTFTIQWVGPFKNIDEVKLYEKNENTADKSLFSFYYFNGHKYKQRKNKTFRYFGIRKKNDSITKRLNAKHERFSLYDEDKDLNIWIGAFGCMEDQIDRNIEDVETLIISTYSEWLENIRKKTPPSQSICIINRWYDKNELEWINRKSDTAFIDDVIVYEKEYQKVMTSKLKRKYTY